MEPHYPDPRPADEFLPRSHGRLRRRCRRSCRVQSPHPWRLDQAGALHFSLAGHRLHRRYGRYGYHQLDRPQPAPAQSRPLVPPAATHLRRRLQPRPRHQRRPERHGHHHHCSRRRRPDEDLRRPLLGHYLLPPRHGRRHYGGRLAHHQNHGPAHYQTHPIRRLFRRNPPRPHLYGHRAFRHPSQHHPHHPPSPPPPPRLPPPFPPPPGRDAA